MRASPGSHGAGARLFLAATHTAGALGVCAALCLVSAVWPPSRVTPVGVWYAAAASLAAVAAGVLVLRRRPRAPLVALVVAVVIGGVLVWSCRTLAGVVTTSLGLVAAGQAAALLGGRQTVRALLGLVVVALGAGMAASPVPFRPVTWLVLASTTVAMSALVSFLVTRLRVIATTDDLTGALTRAAFDERAGVVLHGAARRGVPSSVVCLDVDDFKEVNDTRGHQAGDEVLVRLVETWRGALGRDDVLGRIGGDEFAVVLTGRTADGAQAWAHAAGALRTAEDPTWSHGVAQVRAGEPVHDALARADSAMYASKGRRADAVH
ncbi:GGDEF domain-containing protein [Cellulomonas endometrii]|uniref:GGDEF domain-containing protein n=1 Tax=Cellulomonas endometrii TaxID=3036301 RepID=UPI0024AC8ABA|nr:GGDEF domain-containing protein [Cellulomonas endometrii]